MKKILLIISLFLLLININTYVSLNAIERPMNIPADAQWDERNKTWDKNYDFGCYTIWYQNGTVMVRITKVEHKKLKINKKEKFYQNGKLKQIGYEIYIDYLRDNIDGGIAGWKPLGKWREYNEAGKINREWCYSLIMENGYWTVAPCGDEIEYSVDGKMINQKNYRLKCEFDCNEYDPLKNSKLN